MADAALANAEARLVNVENDLALMRVQIEAIQKKITAAEAERDKVRSFIATWHEMAGIPLPEHLGVTGAVPDTTPGRIRPKNPDRDLVVDKSLEIIREAHKPIPRKELFDALTARGIVIRGKDPEMVLSTMLWRTRDRVARLPKHGYWPADEVYAPGNYYPSLENLIGAAAEGPEDDQIADEDDELPLA